MGRLGVRSGVGVPLGVDPHASALRVACPPMLVWLVAAFGEGEQDAGTALRTSTLSSFQRGLLQGIPSSLTAVTSWDSSVLEHLPACDVVWCVHMQLVPPRTSILAADCSMRLMRRYGQRGMSFCRHRFFSAVKPTPS